jgi:hypothetical protein
MQKVIYQCPVCGYSGLPRPPSDYLICSCCGTEFGYDDFVTSYVQLRQRWMSLGSPWFSHTRPPPQGWDAFTQLSNSGFLPLTFSLDSQVTTVKAEMRPEVTDRPLQMTTTSPAMQFVGPSADQRIAIKTAA